MSPFIEAQRSYVLPPGYDPFDDKGLLAVEQFLGYDVPPDSVRLVRLGDARWAAEAVWYRSPEGGATG